MKVARNIQQLKPYIPGMPIEELKRKLGKKTIYKLASNESSYAPFYIRSAILKELANINRYPEGGCFYLRRTLAKKLKIKGDQLVFGNGSDELIVMALRAFCDTTSEVIVGFPTFLIYELQARVTNAKVKKIPLKDYRYDLDAMAGAVNKKTKIVFIANPDNPHGTYCTHKEVARFLRSIPKDILVFFDEAYYEFAPKKDFPKTLALLRKRKNIIIARTFSKAYGLAGLRIGYGITDKRVARVLNTIREPFNVNRFAQVGALAALKNKGYAAKVVASVEKEKNYLYKELKKLGINYVKSATNFVLINFGDRSRAVYTYLLEKGIIVRDLSSWGRKNHFRLTVGTRKENSAFIKELKGYSALRLRRK